MELLKFIREHENWEELLSAEPYNIKISRDEDYIMFKYNQLSSDFSLELVRECRGLVLRDCDKKPVCYPFYKFGNYGESYCPDIDWSSASVQEKVDGSLMKVWFDNGWHISTNGTIDAFKADLASHKYHTFGELFEAALPIPFEDLVSVLDENFVYMFELVSPENRVVIPYEKTELYFLGARDMTTLVEYKPEETELFKHNLFKIPHRFSLHSLSDVKKAAEALPWDEEGYVVCDKYFNRVKIKSPEYVKAHYARNNGFMSYEKLLEVILAGEKEEFLIYASDYKELVDKIEMAYHKIIDDVKAIIERLKPETFESRKEYAAAVLKEPAWAQGFLFKYNDLDNFISKVRVSKWIEFMQMRGDLDE